MLASSKEIQQLKRLVKQMKIENEKIKEINRKFETIAQNVLQENQQLKRKKNVHDVFQIENSNDDDVCALILKCLTYEVSSQMSIEEDFLHCQQKVTTKTFHHDEFFFFSKLKQTRLQNEHLKNQFEQIQNVMTKQIEQMTNLKDETEKFETKRKIAFSSTIFLFVQIEKFRNSTSLPIRSIEIGSSRSTITNSTTRTRIKQCSTIESRRNIEKCKRKTKREEKRLSTNLFFFRISKNC